MILMKLGRCIGGLRETRGTPHQVERARTVGLAMEFISLVDRGVKTPSVARLERFAKALRVMVVDLFAFERRRKQRGC